ncbi:unnamed protein product [Discosporangium mesarthrocarpum]
MSVSGIVGDLWVPVVGHRHNGYLIERSRLNSWLSDAQHGMNSQYYTYGDNALPQCPTRKGVLGKAQVGPLAGERERKRECVLITKERGFGKIINISAFLDHKNLKLHLQPMGKLYIVDALLTNVYTCPYSTRGTEHFGVQAPKLKEFFAMCGH